MPSVNQILSAAQGAYDWPERNCVTTGMELYESLSDNPSSAVREIFGAFLTIKKEERAWRDAFTLGGPLVVWRTAMGETAIEVSDLRPGDFVFFREEMRIGNHIFPAKEGREGLGFVDGGYAILYWTPDGMRPVSAPYPPRTVLRIA